MITVKTETLQWFVAGVDLQGQVDTLVRSEPGDLAAYQDRIPDEQLSFLRHRLSGAMQKGCDRLWQQQAKAACIVLIADDHLPPSETNLLSQLAEHLSTWMTRPPVCCFRASAPNELQQFSRYQRLAGQLDAQQTQALEQAIPQLVSSLDDPNAWELLPKAKA